MDLHAIILAGGRGERFWPLSRRDKPKQLLSLMGEETLFEATLRRMSHGIESSRTWIVAGVDIRSAIERLPGLPPPSRMIWEPVGRNTAAAIGAAAERVLATGDGDLLIVPCDHWIPDGGAFWDAVDRARRLLPESPLITFGIAAVRPDTGYGYIEKGEAIDASLGAWRVSRFHEKPVAARAEAYVQSGRCFWNSGIFLFRAAAIARLLRLHLPDMAPVLDRLREDLAASAESDERADRAKSADESAWRRYFEAAPSVSIDHGVLERAEGVAVIEARFAWSDLGTWTSLGERVAPDASGNRRVGDTLALDTEDSILYAAEGGLIATLGVTDLIVVRVGDVTLVCSKDKAQEVRRLVREGVLDARLERYF